MTMPRPLVLLALLCLSLPVVGADPTPSSPWSADLSDLLRGVETIGIPGLPGTLSVFGPDAFPVLTAEAGGRAAPVAGAARLGSGRVVALGHNGWFGSTLKQGDGIAFLSNALRWAAAGKSKPRLRVATWRELPGLLRGQDFQIELTEHARWHTDLESVDVLCVRIVNMSAAQAAALEAFVRRGGGLVCGMPGWGWKQLNPGKDLATQSAANVFLARAGLIWGSDTIRKPKSGRLSVAVPDPLTHAARALDALVALDERRPGAPKVRLARGEAALAVATVTRCVRDLPPQDPLYLPRLGRLLKRAAGDPRHLPSAAAPLTDHSGLGKLMLTLQLKQSRAQPADQVPAHPAAAIFPGAVPEDAKPVARRISIDLARPDWHGTGLYAIPGQTVTVTLPRNAENVGLALRIGAHTDKLWGKEKWRRVPEISRVFPLRSAKTVAANAFGGLLYIVVPRGMRQRVVSVLIEGAVEAPRFVLGKTTPREWRMTLRQHPAPWAELETNKVILTIPSANVRQLEDPGALLRFWDQVLDADADLSATDRDRMRPERFVTDEQISVGYMHSGYPIMTHLDAAPRFVDLATLSSKGDWGMFHELGHNHQHRDWTFSGTVEVTCNLYSLYCMETVCREGKIHKAMSEENMQRAMALHRKGGRSFEIWKKKPFLALIMYHQLQRAFGWETYKKVFATYRELSASQRPRSDADKRDQWMVRFSKVVGKNLGPFFEAWGLPVSEKARASIEALPDWMPEGMK